MYACLGLKGLKTYEFACCEILLSLKKTSSVTFRSPVYEGYFTRYLEPDVIWDEIQITQLRNC